MFKLLWERLKQANRSLKELGYGHGCTLTDLVITFTKMPIQLCGRFWESRAKVAIVICRFLPACALNCLAELGYAYRPKISQQCLQLKKVQSDPFLMGRVFSRHHWIPLTWIASDRQREFQKHWTAIKNQSSIIDTLELSYSMNAKKCHPISVNIEASGPIPGSSSMLSVGAAESNNLNEAQI